MSVSCFTPHPSPLPPGEGTLSCDVYDWKIDNRSKHKKFHYRGIYPIVLLVV